MKTLLLSLFAVATAFSCREGHAPPAASESDTPTNTQAEASTAAARDSGGGDETPSPSAKVDSGGQHAPVHPVALPKLPDRPFQTDERFPECIHPVVIPRCKGGWCYVEPGCFIYGSPEDTPSRGAVTEDQGPVTITKHLLFAQTEVTNSAWQGANMPMPIYPFRCEDETCPVTGMDWYEAAEYANHLSRTHAPALTECYELVNCVKDKGLVTCEDYSCSADCSGFRLPTNAEWQYAAKAGTTTHFYSGDMSRDEEECYQEPLLDGIAWYCDNSDQLPHPVGLRAPNHWGLLDMLGNAMEWGAETGGFSPTFPATDPFRENHPITGRAELGGAYLAQPSAVRAAKVLGSGHQGTVYVGFRLVRTLSETEAAEWRKLPPTPLP